MICCAPVIALAGAQQTLLQSELKRSPAVDVSGRWPCPPDDSDNKTKESQVKKKTAAMPAGRRFPGPIVD
ncbi:hypothetical protein PC116_g3386 [Phytophthora cactorum]|uniref:Uncharacterized protein n=1 Tax=Phytophthora cactorum TaxID=29920 RepID=A0A8T1EK36_9STRA|nr:hypothetical protein Pcac1_g13572 [Phytophthora cactorum]KAG2954058.1 hypothetical protein PC117_g1515 [Phytophthora cactorum]KAG3031569.1 hypothetical protein PC120_g3030 [Phytophthora cactorum]KAG3037744.1 hypothetical protein PC119_g3405 [Phytophthora cactorum]KAG3201264.1 hypothetical protein PC128_g3979 [Phytophthora cactorum]